MARQPRLDAPGTLHHVIVRGIEKRRIVDDKIDRDNFEKEEKERKKGTSYIAPVKKKVASDKL